jgi:DnaJ-domain-containing protein 1
VSRERAIALFKQGTDPAFDLDQTMARFASDCGHDYRLVKHERKRQAA